MEDRKRNYLSGSFSSGYPAGEAIFYECTLFGKVLQSMPAHSMACTCRNIVVDSDSGRVSVKEKDKFKVFSTD